MPLYPVTPPTLPAVSLDDAKANLRITFPDDDVYLAGLIKAAEQSLDGRDGWLGRALVSQTWDYKIHCFRADYVRIPLPPLIEIVTASYYDRDNVLQTLSPSVYEVVGVGGFGKAKLALKYGQAWPATYHRAEAISIRFRCGHVDTSDSPPSGEVPAPIAEAIKRMVGTLYLHREHVVPGETVVTIPAAASSMLAPYRVWT
jgi:uncharacterized phiE125 gp8 family phage protein